MSLESFQAAMVLSAVGNCIGKHYSRKTNDAQQFHVKSTTPVQECIVLHIATAEALATGKCGSEFLQQFAMHCTECMSSDMEGRDISDMVLHRISQLQPLAYPSLFAPYDKGAVDNCSSIRSMVIGLRFHKPNHVDELIASVIESTRVIHHHPLSYLGALTTALFTSFAIQEREPREWGAGLLAALRLAFEYIVSIGKNVSENGEDWYKFEERWKEFLSIRGILDGERSPKFSKKHKIKDERDAFYERFTLPGWKCGSCSHDAPLIAYDAILYCTTWKDLCQHAMHHGGDCCGSGAIAGGWWGILHGFDDVPANNYEEVEFKSRLISAATSIYNLSWM